jgi:hypothetical protein
MDWQVRQRQKQLQLELARLKRERKQIKAEGDRKIREVKAKAAAEIAAVHAQADAWVAEISDMRDRGEAFPRDVVADEWYISVYCQSCLWPIPIFRDVTKGKVGLAARDARLQVTCPRPECGEVHEYQTQQAVNLQALDTGSLPGPRPRE